MSDNHSHARASNPLPPKPHPLAPIAGRRLKQVGQIGALRFSRCELSRDLPGLLRVIANALKVRNNRAPLPEEIRAQLQPLDQEVATLAMLQEASHAAANDARLISHRRAGALVHFSSEEAWVLMKGDVAISLWPADETEDERAYRRETRSREMARRRQALAREKRRAANVATTRHAVSNCSVTASCNIGQANAVLVAIRGGAHAPTSIADATGIKISTVRPLLSRLVKSGAIVSPSRGRYVLAEPTVEMRSEAHEDLTRGLRRVGVAAHDFIERIRIAIAPIAVLSARMSTLTSNIGAPLKPWRHQCHEAA